MALALDGPRSKELQQKAKAVYDAVVTYGKPIVHYGFIPTIILLGMTMTEPAPHFVQLISPL